MGSLNIIENYLTKNRCYQANQKRKPIGIQIHSIGTAQGTAQAVADYWNQSSVSACVTYICDSDTPGKVLKLLDEDVYTWADAGYGNRNLITIEMCESDFMHYISGASYDITNGKKFEDDIMRSYDTCVALCADICTRYGWNPMSKLPSGLYLISSHDEGRLAGLSFAHVDPTHIWSHFKLTMDNFRKAVVAAMKNKVPVAPDIEPVKYYRVRKSWTDPSSQIGAFVSLENAKAACPYLYKVFDDSGNLMYSNKTKPKTGTQATVFTTLTETEAAEKILDIVRTVDKSGIFPSVTATQMILESGYGKTKLALAANNLFGMKAMLSGNSWDSFWDGKAVVNIDTWEVYDGKSVTIDAAFRKYPDIETSIKDHSAYLLGAMDGSKKRYAGLLEAKDYTEAITIIKNGGYATDPNYIPKLTSIVQRFGLDRYDAVKAKPKAKPKPKKTTVKKRIYRVQVGLYENEHLAKGWAASVREVSGFDTAIINENGHYQVICGSYAILENAKDRMKTLIDIHGIGAIVKEAFVKEI